MQSIWKATGIRPADLDPPCAFPELLSNVWRWFGELSVRRGQSELGPLPISWADMAAWNAMTQANPAPREVELIMQLDVVYFESRSSNG
ncbi:phage tail assembly chaperone [Chromobacterium amazonense]|uniref:phage tail assembly chaperone n=1 Tax=Chromobacterium amazonense TaxID=1382803 RepID=UPI003B967BB9